VVAKPKKLRPKALELGMGAKSKVLDPRLLDLKWLSDPSTSGLTCLPAPNSVGLAWLSDPSGLGLAKTQDASYFFRLKTVLYCK